MRSFAAYAGPAGALPAPRRQRQRRPRRHPHGQRRPRRRRRRRRGERFAAERAPELASPRSRHLFGPRPLWEREGPAAQRWEGEGAKAQSWVSLAATARKRARAASRLSAISAAISSGGGRLSGSSWLASLSQKMSRLSLSRFTNSS